METQRKDVKNLLCSRKLLTDWVMLRSMSFPTTTSRNTLGFNISVSIMTREWGTGVNRFFAGFSSPVRHFEVIAEKSAKTLKWKRTATACMTVRSCNDDDDAGGGDVATGDGGDAAAGGGDDDDYGGGGDDADGGDDDDAGGGGGDDTVAVGDGGGDDGAAGGGDGDVDCGGDGDG